MELAAVSSTVSRRAAMFALLMPAIAGCGRSSSGLTYDSVKSGFMRSDGSALSIHYIDHTGPITTRCLVDDSERPQVKMEAGDNVFLVTEDSVLWNGKSIQTLGAEAESVLIEVQDSGVHVQVE